MSAKLLTPTSRTGARMRGSLAAAIAKLREDVQEQALRSAVYAGAKVLAAELEARVPVDDGVLKDAIYTKHVDGRSNTQQQVYHVGVNVKKASHWFNVEYGHWRVNVVFRGPDGKVVATRQRLPEPVWVPASPYLRPTWDTRADDALRAMQRRLPQRLRELRAESSVQAPA